MIILKSGLENVIKDYKTNLNVIFQTILNESDYNRQ